MKICVGIDPSINSTGVCVLEIDDSNNQNEFFYIIKNGKLTKREKEAAEKYADKFKYCLYEKFDIGVAEDNHQLEYFKTLNMISICEYIWNIIYTHAIKYNDPIVYIVQEGISYGSTIRTKSVFDLAGLNYIIRVKFISNKEFSKFIIATPGEIKKFTTGSGNCKKEQMVELFKLTHSTFDIPKIDDVADAYWMATYAKKIMNN